MDEGVRLLFERALDGEPAALVDDMAREARVAGRRLRRRRGLAMGAAAGVVAVVTGAIAITATPQPAGDTTPPVPSRVARILGDPACTFPASGEVADAVIVLRADITDRQRRELGATLRSDPEVRDVRFQSRAKAYERFKRIYSDAPDLVAAVNLDQVPESYLVTLAEPAAYAGFFAQFTEAGGVDDIVGYRCPDGARKGAGR
jgi:hypothetical protein